MGVSVLGTRWICDVPLCANEPLTLKLMDLRRLFVIL